eukprot:3961139-Karenia_brevis.AAC.1
MADRDSDNTMDASLSPPAHDGHLQEGENPIERFRMALGWAEADRARVLAITTEPKRQIALVRLAAQDSEG